MPNWLSELEAAHKAAETPIPQEYPGPAGISLTFDHDHNVFPPLAGMDEEQVGGPTAVFSHPGDAKLYVCSRNRLPDLLRIARAALAAEEYVPCTCDPSLPNEQCPGCVLREALEGTDDGE